MNGEQVAPSSKALNQIVTNGLFALARSESHKNYIIKSLSPQCLLLLLLLFYNALVQCHKVKSVFTCAALKVYW